MVDAVGAGIAAVAVAVVVAAVDVIAVAVVAPGYPEPHKREQQPHLGIPPSSGP